MSSEVPPRPDIPSSPDIPPEHVYSSNGHREKKAEESKVTWRWWEAVGVYMVGVLGGIVLGGLTFMVLPEGSGRFFAAGILAEAVPAGVIYLWLRSTHPGWKEAIGFPDRITDEIGPGVVFGFLLYVVVAFGIGLLLAFLFRQLFGEDVSTPAQLPEGISGLAIWWAAILALVAAPISEELFFRGCLYKSLRARHSFVFAAIASAIVFGLAHWGFGGDASWRGSLLLVTLMVFTGFGLARLYEKRKNIVAPMFAHAAFNLLGLAFIIGTQR
ncbi:MAG: CPBP family intramembrane glutamic endopeptidase [Actinomycetota bacterium]